MALPHVGDFTAALVANCDGPLGDPVRYRVAGGEWQVIDGAKVDYGGRFRDEMTGRWIEQDHRVAIAKLLLPAKPTGNDRLNLPDYPGIAFMPVNINEVGMDWTFEVKRVG